MQKTLILLTAIATIALLTTSLVARSEQRLALVIGNTEYAHLSRLPNATNDGRAMEQKLLELGFQVVSGYNLGNEEFRKTILRFRDEARSADVALVFYAGHGIGISGENYLIPVDAKLRAPGDHLGETIPLQQIQAVLEARPRTNIIFFDACRNDPFITRLEGSLGRSAAGGGGWVEPLSSNGTFITFATSPGEVAYDGIAGGHSPFTQSLLDHVAMPDTDIALMMRKVRGNLNRLTDNKQKSWSSTSLIGGFMFAPTTRAILKDWLVAEKKTYRRNESIRLRITPPRNCKLTLINVDDRGQSCILHPRPEFADQTYRASETTGFPPPPYEDILIVKEAGRETFVALCDASQAAIDAETRRSAPIDCADHGARGLRTGARANEIVHELATLNFAQQPAAKSDVGGRSHLLRSSIVLDIAE